ncbi:hypothetical protein TrST_g10212 [Triparma strigata]|uniref:Uncharacterized protein n=1 Tax=Triparma strigata TaxID=1606541 RepID=A0A9W7AIR2_9STRA|nr:hypothetical protein TrST_g10212 [Triparma strigata]
MFMLRVHVRQLFIACILLVSIFNVGAGSSSSSGSLSAKANNNDNSSNQQKRNEEVAAVDRMEELLQDPNINKSQKSLLSQAASKIPAIKRSQDFFLRIRTSNPLDGVLAASVLNSVADAAYPPTTHMLSHANAQRLHPLDHADPCVDDRRFEQLVECVLCMVEPYLEAEPVLQTNAANGTTTSNNQTEAEVMFKLRDAAKAAYALTRLSAHNCPKLSSHPPRKIISSLSKLSTSLLLSPTSSITLDDLAYCSYVFGYVYTFTGIHCASTLEACCTRLINSETKEMSKSAIVMFLLGLGWHKIEMKDDAEKGVEAVKRKLVRILKKGVEEDADNTIDINDTNSISITNLNPKTPPPTSNSTRPSIDVDSAKIAVAAASVERETMKNGATVVVDAEQLLAAAKAEEEEVGRTEEVLEKMEKAEGGEEHMAEEVITKIEQVEVEEVTPQIPDKDVEDDQGQSEAAEEQSNPDDPPPPPEFTPQDLSIIMWSLSSLSKQTSQILNLAVKHLHLLGPSAFSKMEGSDLANVAWAIAKGSGKNLYSKKTRKRLARDDVKGVLGQIAKWSLVRMGVAPDDIPVDCRDEKDGPDSFQPSTLSKLMWAVAFCSNKEGGQFRGSHDILPKLAQSAVEIAGSRLKKFSPDELGRIAWAYGKLGDISQSQHISHTCSTTGRIYASIENSLREWETEQRGPEGTANIPLNELPMDPGILCKATWSFVRLLSLSNSNNRRKYGNDLVHLTSKIFTGPRSELLLKSMSSRDLARLISSAAMSLDGGGVVLTSGEGTSKRRSTFVGLGKKYVEVLNEDGMANILPGDVAEIIWSLAELGVSEELDVKVDFGVEDVEELEGTLNSKVLSGLMTMGYFNRKGADLTLLYNLLVGLNLKVGAFGVGDIRRSVWILTKVRKNVRGLVRGSVEEELEEEEEEGEAKEAKEAKEVKEVDGREALLDDIGKILGEITDRLAVEAKDMVTSLSASDMRVILQSYLFLGVRNEEMFGRIKEEVSRRLSVLSEPNKEVWGEGMSFNSIVGNLRKSVESGEGDGRIAEAIKEAGVRLERLRSGTGCNVESIFNDVEDEASFELGRCKEVIERWERGGWEGGDFRREEEGRRKGAGEEDARVLKQNI